MVRHDQRRDCSGKDPAPASLPAQPADPESATGDVTQILSQINDGDPSAAEQLLPLVYEELRRLAAAKMAQEKTGQTLQATALVHEAYIRLAGSSQERWENRRHFFLEAETAQPDSDLRLVGIDRISDHGWLAGYAGEPTTPRAAVIVPR
jgi:hypothetical protein